jgi:3D (Asp-Asp-Asp) domain-containing protein
LLPAFFLLGVGCRTPGVLQEPGAYQVRMLTTGYCPCQKCCGWKRNWLGRPVYAYGRLKGQPKRVGICADGSEAVPGTIAADTRFYPFGTRFYIPGYGAGTVHDRGGAIQGARHLDLFFNKHREAQAWGRRYVTVTVYPSGHH